RGLALRGTRPQAARLARPGHCRRRTRRTARPVKGKNASVGSPWVGGYLPTYSRVPRSRKLANPGTVDAVQVVVQGKLVRGLCRFQIGIPGQLREREPRIEVV